MSTLQWKKIGLVVKPDPKLWWMRTHAMVPTMEKISESLYKIYFSGRDEQKRSHIGWSLMDLSKPDKIQDISPEPVLSLGALGCFDDNGVTPSCIVKNGTKTHLYYIGWNPGSTTRMNIFGGLAISEDNGQSFQRYSRASILERNRVNPFINTAPWVLKEAENDWTVYYVSGVEWVHKDLPRYNIQMGKSTDGLEWKRDGHICIDFEKGEDALARPCVTKDGGTYGMWFASKGLAYRLKYAESADGMNWRRRDQQVTIAPTPGSYDSEMMEYATVLTYKGQRFMYYNGNNYGADGIALAIEG